MIIHFNNKYSVQPQNNWVLESRLESAQKQKNSTGSLCSLKMHFNALKKNKQKKEGFEALNI